MRRRPLAAPIPLTYSPPQPLLDRVSPKYLQTLALLLIVAIAVADETTGYAMRLSVFYLVPISLATWSSGLFTGVGVALSSSLLWLYSFRFEHLYPNQGLYLWEGAVMLGSFLAVAWLIARLRQALSQADERFMRVLETMHAAVCVVDERCDQVVYANAWMSRMAGSPASGKPSHFERQFQPEADNVEHPPTVPGDAGFSAQTVKDLRSGRWYLMQAGPIPWGSNPDVKLKVLTDITAQKNAELLRDKHFEAMHQAARLTTMAEIASTLAHEINQPLMVIATYTDACQRLLESDNFERKDITAALQKCHAQAVRAASIIERLREFIRQRQHRPVACNPKALVNEAIDMSRTLLDEAQVAVEVTAPPDLILVADRILLLQVLANLMRNAIDAMKDVPSNARILTLAVGVQASGEILFSVADRGPGFDDAAVDAMFSPFFTTKAEGLGLGLAICSSVAEAHGGRLWAANRPQGGAVFFLSIPAQGAAA